MHKDLLPIAREANVARMSSFNDLEQGNSEAYTEYGGYGVVADTITRAAYSAGPETQAIETALNALRRVLQDNQEHEMPLYDIPVRWGIRQLETLLSASSSRHLS